MVFLDSILDANAYLDPSIHVNFDFSSPLGFLQEKVAPRGGTSGKSFRVRANFGPRCAITAVRLRRYLDHTTILPGDEIEQKQITT